MIWPPPRPLLFPYTTLFRSRGMRHDEGLHRRGILLHDVADRRVGVDDDLIGQALQALAVERLVIGKALAEAPVPIHQRQADRDRKSTRLNSSHVAISYAVFC